MSKSGWHRKVYDAKAQARQAEYRSPRYKAARLTVQHQVEAGAARCWRCGKPIPPGTPWHLGHSDTDRSVLMGAEHEACNLKAAASKGARVANAKRKQRRTPRTW